MPFLSCLIDCVQHPCVLWWWVLLKIKIVGKCWSFSLLTFSRSDDHKVVHGGQSCAVQLCVCQLGATVILSDDYVDVDDALCAELPISLTCTFKHCSLAYLAEEHMVCLVVFHNDDRCPWISCPSFRFYFCSTFSLFISFHPTLASTWCQQQLHWRHHILVVLMRLTFFPSCCYAPFK